MRRSPVSRGAPGTPRRRRDVVEAGAAAAVEELVGALDRRAAKVEPGLLARLAHRRLPEGGVAPRRACRRARQTRARRAASSMLVELDEDEAADGKAVSAEPGSAWDETRRRRRRRVGRSCLELRDAYSCSAFASPRADDCAGCAARSVRVRRRVDAAVAAVTDEGSSGVRRGAASSPIASSRGAAVRRKSSVASAAAAATPSAAVPSRRRRRVRRRHHADTALAEIAYSTAAEIAAAVAATMKRRPTRGLRAASILCASSRSCRWRSWGIRLLNPRCRRPAALPVNEPRGLRTLIRGLACRKYDGFLRCSRVAQFAQPSTSPSERRRSK